MLRSLSLLTLCATAALGCSEGAALRGPGESCLRSIECNPGLACVANRCGTDLGGLAEAGMVPMMPMDAGPIDAGPDVGPGVDAGPGVDSGPPPPPMDSGPPPPVDSGPPPVDSGPPPVDSGPPPVDSGPPPGMDSGPGVDSGT